MSKMWGRKGCRAKLLTNSFHSPRDTNIREWLIQQELHCWECSAASHLFDAMQEGEKAPCSDSIVCSFSHVFSWNIMEYSGSWTCHRKKSIIWARAATARALLNNLTSFLNLWVFHYISTLKDKLLLKVESVIAYAMHNRNFRTCTYLIMNKKKNVYLLGFSMIVFYI